MSVGQRSGVLAAATTNHTDITSRTATSTAGGVPGIEWDRAGAAADMMETTTMGMATTGVITMGARLPADHTVRRRHRGPCRRFLGIRATIE